MINLIPPTARKSNRQEYWVRVLSVWGFVFAAICIVGTLFLIPSYVLVSIQLNAASTQAAAEVDDADAFATFEAQIEETNILIKQLDAPKSRVTMSETIAAIEETATPEITLSRFEVRREDNAISSVKVQGSAVSRESLATFRNDLERLARFASAEVPLSDLARDVDLPFVVTITLSSS